MRLSLAVLSAVVFAFGALAGEELGDIGDLVAEADASGVLNVYHWWTAGGEKEAIEAALQLFQERYPNVRVLSNAIPGGAGGAMVMKVKILMVTGNSPESFQAHPGFEIQPYYEAKLLYPLNGVWEYADIANRLLPGIEEWCRVGEEYFLVPIGVHRTNMIWYNKHLFEEYGVKPPEEPVTWEDFWALCEELSAKLPRGKYVLDLGDRRGWPATHVFETIMIGTDPQIYEDFINGVVSQEDLELVLSRFKRFLSYVAPDHPARLWYEAAGRVYAGDIAMYLHGDWIKAYFASRGWVFGEDYGAFPAPGTSGKFGLCIDAFVVPRGSADPENGARWAYLCSDPELQKLFTSQKGCISPYRDTPLEVYDELSRAFLEELLDPNTLAYPSFTHGIALPWEVLMNLHSQISDFATRSNPDVTRFARLLSQSLHEAGVQPTWDIVE